MKLEEVIVGVLIVLVIGLTLLPETEKIITEPVTEISFEAYPLKAWRDGRVVKIIIADPIRVLIPKIIPNIKKSTAAPNNNLI